MLTTQTVAVYEANNRISGNRCERGHTIQLDAPIVIRERRHSGGVYNPEPRLVKETWCNAHAVENGYSRDAHLEDL